MCAVLAIVADVDDPLTVCRHVERYTVGRRETFYVLEIVLIRVFGHVDEWPGTLEALKALDFDVLLPGHGAPVMSKERISYFQTYLNDLWEKTREMYGRGVSAEEAAEQIDMTNHSDNYSQLTGPGVDPRAIRRIYQLLGN